MCLFTYRYISSLCVSLLFPQATELNRLKPSSRSLNYENNKLIRRENEEGTIISTIPLYV